MNRVLIIVTCGLILALIIGATTQSRVRESRKEIYQQYDNKKCSDEVDIKQGECWYHMVGPAQEWADMFLRNIKRKQRMMYASVRALEPSITGYFSS